MILSELAERLTELHISNRHRRELYRLIRPLVGIPDALYVFALIPIGVSAEEKPPRTQYDENKVHWEGY